MNFKPFSSQNENENISYWIAPQDFAHMRQREEEMRDTNESTNSRVLYFSIFSMLCLLGLATWQVLYLRKYFKSKKLIEWASPPIALVVRGLFSTDNVIHSKAVWATDWRGGPHKKKLRLKKGVGVRCGWRWRDGCCFRMNTCVNFALKIETNAVEWEADLASIFLPFSFLS